MMNVRFKDAFLTAVIAGILALPLAGARTVDGAEGLGVEWHLVDVGVAMILIFFGRLLLDLISDGQGTWIAPLAFVSGIIAAYIHFPSQFLQSITVVGSFVLAARAIWVLLRGTSSQQARKNSSPLEGEVRWGGVQQFRWLVFILKLLGCVMPPPLTPPSRGGEQTAFAAQNASIFSRITQLSKNLTFISAIFLVFALLFPFTPLASRYALDVATMVLTYIMLAWGLNITVGYAGLLDLGYAGFYALGAYSTALLARHFGIGFWTALPVAGIIAAGGAFLLGFPVLRLRGDYFAIVTLGFGEIVRLVLTNWTNATGGPNGISDIPRPTLFGLEFTRTAEEGHKTFHEFFGLAFDPTQRVMFIYYLILFLALLVGWFSAKLRRLPIGRAWEAYREDEIACAAIGIDRRQVKLTAYSLGAAVAGLAGSFFATRQGFISPESFTFTESATMLAIVILGGIGHPLGIVLAAIFVVGMPELFREFEQYRMLAFGAGMVLIMLWRPGGMMATRMPTVRLAEKV